MFTFVYNKLSSVIIVFLFSMLMMGCQTTEKGPSDNQQIASELEQIGVSSHEDERGLIITLPTVFFDFDSSNLKSEAREKIVEVAGILSQVIAQNRQISIEGHTDNIGDDNYNLGLSSNRADAVLKELVFSNISEDRLASSGIGEATPIADNSTNEGRQQNRRVEIIVHNPS